MRLFSPQIAHIAFCATFFSVALAVHHGQCQEIPFGAPSGTAAGPMAPIAVTGSPFGVFVAEVPLPPGLENREPRIRIEQSQGRVFFPVVQVRTVDVVGEPILNGGARPRIGRPGGLLDRARARIREANKKSVPVAITVAGLFQGDGPLEIQLTGDITQDIQLRPVANAGGTHRQALLGWWQTYTAVAARDLQRDDFPKLVHKYLVATLARRLQLPPVDLDPPSGDEKESSQPLKTLELLAAIEPLREEVLEDVLSRPSPVGVADRPLPPVPQWQPPTLPPLQTVPTVEDLARRVPPECFYLRFDSFGDFVWFQEIAERHGGDFAQAVMMRGVNFEAAPRMERMLAAKMTTLAKMFGGNLIGELAVVGTDLYMKEGASVGVIFNAKNAALLRTGIEADRKAIAARTPDATVSELTIQGKQVIKLSTPDNRIRSFFVSDESFVMVTTSETLARRFIEVGAGDLSLAQTPNFQWARSWMPREQGYNIFGYFSPEFFRNLVSPHYQIELNRRMEAIAHLEAAEVASQLAKAEGVPADNIDALKQSGLLPQSFDLRADGAKTLRVDDHWIDSLRGLRGSFLPIADVPIQEVTAAEEASYASVASFYQDQWRDMDPLLIGARRFQLEGAPGERVAFEAYVAPFHAEKYGWVARQLAAPTPVEIALPPDDVATAQVHLRGNGTLATGDYHLFAGVKDMLPPSKSQMDGILQIAMALRAVPAYVGSWPKADLIELVPFGLGQILAQPDAAGFSRVLGLWRWQDAQFSLLSFQRVLLESAIPHLAVVATPDPAQARLRISNLEGTQISGWVNQMWYQRGWRSSHANTRLLDVIQQQLRVPDEQCLEVAERLLDVKLQCPLGGDYQVRAVNEAANQIPQAAESGWSWWVSSAWKEAALDASGELVPPAEYQAPWINWFRGAQVHVTQRPESLAAVGHVDMDMGPVPTREEEQQAGLPVMNFDVFSLPGKLFGGGEETPEPENKRRKF